jgi:hypothetical protein
MQKRKITLNQAKCLAYEESRILRIHFGILQAFDRFAIDKSQMAKVAISLTRSKTIHKQRLQPGMETSILVIRELRHFLPKRDKHILNQV